MCREVLDIVLRYEAPHRQFGWDGLDWLLDAHGPGVAQAIEAALPGMLAEVGAAYAATVTRALTADVVPRLEARGLLSPERIDLAPPPQPVVGSHLLS